VPVERLNDLFNHVLNVDKRGVAGGGGRVRLL
jgi:hypothetical protein